MKNLKIRGHPPWYARGTPVIKLRDGPLIRARGKPPLNECVNAEMQECRSEEMQECGNAGMQECVNELISEMLPLCLSSRRCTRRDLQQSGEFLSRVLGIEMTAKKELILSGKRSEMGEVCKNAGNNECRN